MGNAVARSSPPRGSLRTCAQLLRLVYAGLRAMSKAAGVENMDINQDKPGPSSGRAGKRSIEELSDLSALNSPVQDRVRVDTGLLKQMLKDRKQRLAQEKKTAERLAAAAQQQQADMDIDTDLEHLTAASAAAVSAEAGEPEPPIHEQCIFAPFSEASPAALAGGEEVLQGCLDQLQKVAPEAASVPDIPAELVLGGWLREHYLRKGTCPADVAKHLFDLVAYSTDLQLASAAFDCLVGLMGTTSPAHPSTNFEMPTASPLYGEPAAHCTLGWLPDDKAFRKALEHYGYDPKAAAATSKRAARPPGQPPASLCNLQLLWRLASAVCRVEARAEVPAPQRALKAGGLSLLILAAARCRLDPAACLLAPDLQDAICWLADAFPDADWQRKAASLAAEIAAVGPSHRAHLAAVKLLPSDTPRCKLLQAHAAATLLGTLLPKVGKAASGAPKVPSRGRDVDCLDVHGVFASLAWFQAGPEAVFQSVVGPRKAHSLWEVDTAVKAADLLLWTFVEDLEVEDKAGVALVRRWHAFLADISKRLDNSPLGTALKLHFTIVMDRNKEACKALGA
ncbi:hypothetical protein WJX72_003352 [[Myrmecia] bisecta]|uniref:Uncharacterized protein n=1 Tax=[Myrmecia] bisecta TaxID=41462 RepID=A0AAW1QBD9_9CHLO